MATRSIDIEEGVVDVDIVEVTEFDDVGEDALGLKVLARIGEGFEEEREGEVVGEDVGAVHVGV